jgi:hypothetical protein
MSEVGLELFLIYFSQMQIINVLQKNWNQPLEYELLLMLETNN